MISKSLIKFYSSFAKNLQVKCTLTKSKSNLICENGKTLSWYVCGPTVYDEAHIGHARCYVAFDILRRIMEKFFKFEIFQVLGITDIDDKIILTANNEKKTFKEVALNFEKDYFNDMHKLNVMPPSLSLRVSETIPQIQLFIQKLIASNYAYITNLGNVYFDTQFFNKFSPLKQSFIKNEGSNIQNNIYTDKRCVQDFVLWKVSKLSEPGWQNEWSSYVGRPGWHIECSTMSQLMFGDHISLHSGGSDLIQIHHHCETMQCYALNHNPHWVGKWLHCGHLSSKSDHQKMSKSLKNGISITDFLKDYSSDHFRLLCLNHHYRDMIEYDTDLIQKYVTMLNQIKSFLTDASHYFKGMLVLDEAFPEKQVREILENLRNEVLEDLSDDFNTRDALQKVLAVIKTCNAYFSSATSKESITTIYPSPSFDLVIQVKNFVESFFSDLGLNIGTAKSFATSEVILNEVINSSLLFRSKLRNSALKKEMGSSLNVVECCDDFRKELSNLGIEVKDRSDRTFTWQWKNR